MSDSKIDVLCQLLAERLDGHRVDDALVVGCGSGQEAAHLAGAFSARVTGIDIDDRFLPEAAEVADLRVMDAMALDLEDASVDLVYSFHALEHIADPVLALAEMRRVLRPGGWYCVGTPNRSRLVGYVGSRTSLANKLRWNLQDYGMRLRGRFRNEHGAHAGFEAAELEGLCRATFGDARNVTAPYYAGLYGTGRVGTVIRAAVAARVDRYVYPCVYVIGQRRDETG